MRKIYFVMVLLLSVTIGAQADNVEIQDVIDAGLPILYVETVDGEEPTYDVAYAPEGQNGKGITNATKVPGRIRLVQDGIDLYDSGEYVAKTSGMTIKVRGNTSAADSPKKPYKIKLQVKADLLNRGNDAKYADKNWILIKDEGLKVKTGFKVNELLGMQWTPQYMYVNVIFNNEYRGLYMLCESVERNTDCRLNVKKTGYIIELDAYWWNEDKYFDSSISPKMNYTYKYPDSEDVTEDQNNYIQGVVDDFEASLANGTYLNYIDINSFTSWMLGHDLLGSKDGDGSNIYLTKYDNSNNTKLTMGPLWDFDGAMDYTTFAERFADVHWKYYFASFFNNPNKSFVRTYKNKWNQIKSTLFDDIDDYLETYSTTEECVALERSLLLDNTRWNRSLTTIADRIAIIRTWFSSRHTWLETNIAAINDHEAIFSNSVTIQNEGSIQIEETDLTSGDTFNTTACTDVILTFIPGTNMSLTSLLIDGNDVTDAVTNSKYTLSNVLSAHSVDVRYDRNLMTLGEEFSTYCSTADLNFAGMDNLKAYIVSSYDTENNAVILSRVFEAPAGTGLILKGIASESYTIPIIENASSIAENLLVGVNSGIDLEPTDGIYNNYILAKTSKGIGFNKLTASGHMSAGKCYLQLPASANAKSFKFDFSDGDIIGITTTIKLESSDSSSNIVKYYNLLGQRVNDMNKKGIFIKNGVKVIKK